MISQEIHENWTFRIKGEDIWFPASVPGTVHTDLLQNEKIKDPFFGINANDQQWIETEDWEYRCVFNISNYLLDHDHVEIWFYGVDTFAEISLNGTKILSTNNMFHPWSKDVKNLLHEGENILDVCFISPYKKGLEKYSKFPYTLPAPNDRGEQKVSPFCRKAAYHFGWDWAPRLCTSGFWKNIEILAFNKLKIRDYFIQQVSQTAALAKLVCNLELEVHSAGEYIFAIYVDKDLISIGKLRASAGVNKFNLPFDIYNPRLWYPRGYGKPDVYKITIDIKENDFIIDTRQTTTGIRKIELVRSGEPGQEGFQIRVNGIDIYAKGANLVPLDYFLPRIKPEQYRSLIDNAISLNMNMLRLWGGGIYENDSFYNLCNAEGILIWQDFMFACIMYPSDNDFLSSIYEEVEYNIKRLRNHPSLALWCGNNEILEGFHNWGWKEELGENADNAFLSYKKIFQELIPEILNELDGSRPYVSSSPSAFGDKAPTLTSGDYHYWDIIKKPLPISSYEENVGRFMSEYGFKSFSELASIIKFAGDETNIHSEVMEAHQLWENGTELVERHVQSLYGKTDNFDDFLYFSQLTQAKAIKTAIEAHRRAKPKCSGTLFWQFNDCWPCTSWSAIDYYGNWKALMYAVKHAFADVIISPIIHHNLLEICVVNDRKEALNIVASVKLLNFDGEIFYSKELEKKVSSSSSEKLFSVPIESMNIGKLKSKLVILAELFSKDKRLDQSLLYLVNPSELKLKPANFTLQFVNEGNKSILYLKSTVLLKDVYLKCEGESGFFSENYFDLLAGDTKPIIYQSDSESSGERTFTLKCLNTLTSE